MSKKSRIRVGLTALVVLILAPALQGTQKEPVLSWHTYAGSTVDDVAAGVAEDPGGNVFLTGWSDATWGSPILPHSGGRDNFVAKLKSTGELEWNTFLGPTNAENPSDPAIAADGSGNVVVVGTILGEAPFFRGLGQGLFVAKLNSHGELQWRNLGAETYDGSPTTVAVDTLGNIYVGGWGGCWSEPGAHVGDGSWVAKLDSSGAEVWRTLVGCSFGGGQPQADRLAVDASGNVYLTGRSTLSWGTPINPHAGGLDAFVSKLNSDGSHQWNTFMGSPGGDGGLGIAVDRTGNVYVSGSSDATWGTPIKPKGTSGGFVAKLDNNGVRQWNTFEGGLNWAVAVDGAQNVYVTGVGNPGYQPGYLLSLNRDGILQWNTSLGAPLDEMALGGRHVYVAGQIFYSWGTPVHPYSGGWDAFVAKLETTVEINIDIKPGSFPNRINPGSSDVIPVAILTTPTFDATTVDPLSVRFGRDEAEEMHGTGHIEDVDADGDLDMLFHFVTAETGIQWGNTSATLTGETLDGLRFEGQDSIATVGWKPRRHLGRS